MKFLSDGVRVVAALHSVLGIFALMESQHRVFFNINSTA